MGSVKIGMDAARVLKKRTGRPDGRTPEAPLAPVRHDLTDDEAAAVEAAVTASDVIAGADTLRKAGRVSASLALLRRAWTFGRSRREQIELTLRACDRDEEFGRLVAQADEARDRGDHPLAEWNYERALELYPIHPGYHVQYAHALKDQERFEQAEVHYRTALALGAPAADVHRHLQFVAHRQGYDASPPAPAAWPGGLLDPPTHLDIDTLGYLAFRWQRMPDWRRLDLLRHCATGEDVMARLAADEAFPAANARFLEILAAQP